MRKLLGWISLVSVALILAGCAAKPMESELLSSSVQAARFDSKAEAQCTSTLGGPWPLIAAVDSTTSEIIETAKEVDAYGDWQSELPPNPDNYIAICVYDIDGADLPFGGDPDYMAYWVGTGDVDQQHSIGGAILFTTWTKEEIH